MQHCADPPSSDQGAESSSLTSRENQWPSVNGLWLMPSQHRQQQLLTVMARLTGSFATSLLRQSSLLHLGSGTKTRHALASLLDVQLQWYRWLHNELVAAGAASLLAKLTFVQTASRTRSQHAWSANLLVSALMPDGDDRLMQLAHAHSMVAFARSYSLTHAARTWLPLERVSSLAPMPQAPAVEPDHG